MIILLGGFFR